MALDPSSAVVTRREAAESLDLTERQVDRLIKTGDLVAIKSGHKVQVTVDSLAAERMRRAPRALGAPIEVAA